MLPEIITFNKSLEYRLEEYELLLDEKETACSDIIEIWGSLLSELAVIGVDWQALWVLSESNCRKYNLLYPTAVIVNVDEFQFSDLTATVSVVAVQEDILLPSMLDVPLIELHPIKNQNYDEIDLTDIEDWLDKCRYFFEHLWYPWDAETEVSLRDWCESHLENRLKMQYDLKNGFFDKSTKNYLKLLLAEARCSLTDDDVFHKNDRVTTVARYIHRENVKTELFFFEEPDMRHGIIQLKKKNKRLKKSSDNGAKEAKLIWVSGTCECLLQYIEKAQSLLGKNTAVKMFGSLQEALDSSESNDIVILPPGEHTMNSLSGIENGGVIKGWDEFGSEIKPDVCAVSKAIMFECFGYIELENLVISKSSGIAIQIFEGTVKLTRCRLISERNSTSRGIVVISGSKLVMEKCEIHGFGTGIAVQAKAQAFLMDCEIRNCFEGIKVTENAKVSLDKVNISLCSTYGIRVDSRVESEIPLIGDLNLLEGDSFGCEVTTRLVQLRDNLKGNVIVKQMEEIFMADELSESHTSREDIYITDEVSENDSVEII